MSPTVVQFGTAQTTIPVILQVLEGESVAPPGYAIRVNWTPVAGADGTEIDTGSVSVGPATATVALGALTVTQAGDNAVDVVIPGAPRVRSLTLTGLKLADGSELRSAGDFAGNLRLSVSHQIGTTWTPLCVVPALGGRGVLPAPLTGASYSAGVLTLPDPPAARLRLSLVKGDKAEELNAQPTRVASAHGLAAVRAHALELVMPDGSVPWSAGAELTAAQTVDPRTPLRLALEAALAAGGPPDVTMRLKGPAGVRARMTVTAAHGALLRRFPGTLSFELAAAEEPLAPAAAPLAAEAPASAVADVVVRYAGVRLHDAVRDAVPGAGGGVAGPVVGEQPVVRALPPLAFADRPLARAAPIGRAPEGCQLSVTAVDLGAGAPGTPLGPPGTIELAPSEAIAAHWAEMPPQDPPAGAPGLSLRATAGRFLWAAGADGTPLARLAVHDPDPGGRPVRLDGATLATVEQAELSLPAHGLPAAALRGPAPPRLGSDLFCTVELADLTLRYAR